ncbi:MAG TPA: hypothetical protein ENL06_00755, partial [Candidatus Portnoybacteria bacterium]|nr:hypothetical protein [Candidatus Portnoybacteria bacterium]
MNQESKNYQPKKQLKQTETRICQNCGKEFTIEPEDFEFYEKIGVPAPTFCPECRLQRKMMFRNERKLYKRKCDLCGRDIISIYPQDTPFPVYCSKCWNSDKWDPTKYGRDYNFNKPFFEQFKELIREVPRLNLVVYESVNSDYTNLAGQNKDCYLIVSSGYCEKCMYGYRYMNSNEILDSEDVQKSELCYQCFQSSKCYKCAFVSNCENCVNVYFSKNCSDCSNCFGCVNLKHKQYCIFNKQYSKEEYFEKLKEFNLGSYRKLMELRKKAEEFWLNFPVKYMHGRNNVNVSGDYIDNSKNVINSYYISNGEDLKLVIYADKALRSLDSGYIDFSELCYESFSGDKDSRKYFTFACWGGSYNLRYCDTCKNSNNLFGCSNLSNKQYCILNKQYTKEEYEKLVPKIIEHMNKMPYISKIQNAKIKNQNHNSKLKTEEDSKPKEIVYRYGEFFPPELSPFAYNETIAQEYFPLTKEEAIEKGYQWSDQPKNKYQPTIKAKDLPDNIKDVDDSITQEIIECENHSQEKEGKGKCQGSGVYRILPQELEFYRRMNLP